MSRNQTLMRKYNITKVGPVLILVITTIATVVGQAKSSDRAAKIRLDGMKPTVYLTLKEVVGAPAFPQLVRLELHNNTRWEILCYTIPERSSDGLLIIYKLEDREGKSSLVRDIGDVIIPRKVKPGESVTFLVPLESFTTHKALYVEFNYIWEYRDHMAPYPHEPNHRVYFFSANLPSSMLNDRRNQ